MKPKIAILGCGWLGLPLAISFLESGFFVVGSTTSEDKLDALNSAGINGIVWSLNDGNSVQTLDFFADMDVLILNIPPSKSKGEIKYSKALSAFCSKISLKTRVIFVSTTSVYPNDIALATEDYCWQKEDLLEETVQAEIELTKVLDSRLTILRLAGLIGLNRHPIFSLSGKQDVFNGNSPVNLIHLNDAIGLLKTIVEKKFWGEILNGCFPIYPTRAENYEEIAE